MHQGALKHFSRSAQHVVTSTFHGRWMGRRGLTSWPERLPDLNPVGMHKILMQEFPVGNEEAPSRCGCLPEFWQLLRHV
jgi:hypothetical protein